MATGNVFRGRVGEAVSRTRFAIGAALRRPSGQAVFAGVSVLYLVGYLRFSNLLTFDGSEVNVVVARNPAARFFQPANSAMSFEPVALVEFGFGTYLFSLNTFIGLGIALLVGLNLAVTSVAWQQPKACGVASSSSGVLVGLPALLSGAACCGPVVLIVFGIQASSTLVTVFQWLVPAAVVLLLGSLVWIGQQVDPSVA